MSVYNLNLIFSPLSPSLINSSCIIHHPSLIMSCNAMPCHQDILDSVGAMKFDPDLVAKDTSVAKILNLKDDVSGTS